MSKIRFWVFLYISVQRPPSAVFSHPLGFSVFGGIYNLINAFTDIDLEAGMVPRKHIFDNRIRYTRG